MKRVLIAYTTVSVAYPSHSIAFTWRGCRLLILEVLLLTLVIVLLLHGGRVSVAYIRPSIAYSSYSIAFTWRGGL